MTNDKLPDWNGRIDCMQSCLGCDERGQIHWDWLEEMRAALTPSARVAEGVTEDAVRAAADVAVDSEGVDYAVLTRELNRRITPPAKPLATEAEVARNSAWQKWVGMRADMLNTRHNEHIFHAGFDAALNATPPAAAQDAEIDAAFVRGFKAARAQFTANPPASAPAAAFRGPLKWTPEEIADGYRGIRWIKVDGVYGRPTEDDIKDYFVKNPGMLNAYDTRPASPAPAQGAGGTVRDLSRFNLRIELESAKTWADGYDPLNPKSPIARVNPNFLVALIEHALATQARPSAVDVRDAGRWREALKEIEALMLTYVPSTMPGMSDQLRTVRTMVSRALAATPPAAQGEKGVG